MDVGRGMAAGIRHARACATHVTQPLICQLIALNHLAPDIQEQLLFLPRLTEGKPAITEKSLRQITMLNDCEEQRCVFGSLFGKPSS